VAKLGLGKIERGAQRLGVGQTPQGEQVQERIERLRAYRWSSYRAYVGVEPSPSWLESQSVLRLGGGRNKERAQRYREYVESAVREGLKQSPWEELRDQVVLGGERFLEQVRGHVKGDEQEQRSAQRLAVVRPDLERVIRCVEQVRGEKWEEFRDRHGDRGRDLVLYLGRSVCGMKLRELAQSVGAKGYASVAMAIRRYAAYLSQNALEQARVKQASALLHVKM
jgi:hypothetical protein